MTPTIVFNIPKETVQSSMNKLAKVLAIVLPNDQVSYKGDIYDIDDKCKSINKHQVYYRYLNGSTRPTKFMLSSFINGELPDARPYRPKLSVYGYISNNKFVIINVIHAHMEYRDNIPKIGLFVN